VEQAWLVRALGRKRVCLHYSEALLFHSSGISSASLRPSWEPLCVFSHPSLRMMVSQTVRSAPILGTFNRRPSMYPRICVDIDQSSVRANIPMAKHFVPEISQAESAGARGYVP
jgi:hypothetical protein